MGPLARAGAKSALQSEPVVLQVPLVLQLLGRSVDELRRSQRRYDAVVPEYRVPTCRGSHGRKVRYGGQSRGSRYASGAMGVRWTDVDDVRPVRLQCRQ